METFADVALGLLGGLQLDADARFSLRLLFLFILTVSLAGLAWLAYKRPALFVERICPRLASLLSVLLLIGLAWNAAVAISAGLLPRDASIMDGEQAQALRQGLQVSYEGLILGFGGGAAYFFFLHRLLHRFAAHLEPPALAQSPQCSAAGERRSHCT